MLKKIIALTLGLMSLVPAFAYTQPEVDDMYSKLSQVCTATYSLSSAENDFKALEEIYTKYKGLTDSSNKLLTTKCYQEMERIVKYSSFSDQDIDKSNNRIENGLKTWKEQYPDSLYANLSLADLYIAKAWDSRGAGFAKDVKKEKLESFHMWMKKADDILNTSIEKGVENIDWYNSKMTTSAIFEPINFYKYSLVALEKFPMEIAVYEKINFFIVPEWLGKPNEQTREDLGEYAVKNFSFEKGRIVYYYLYNVDFKKPLPLMSKSLEKEGRDIILKKYPTPFNQTAMFRLACVKKDNEAMKALYSKVNMIKEIKQYRIDKYFEEKEWKDCLQTASKIK